MTLLHIRPDRASALVRFPARLVDLAAGIACLGILINRAVNGDGHPSKLLRLNDHMLCDMGMSRAELEVEALFWPARQKINHRME